MAMLRTLEQTLREELNAERARLRSLLEPLLAAAEDGYGHASITKPPGVCRGCDAVRDARAALAASTDASDWLLERERRVAERVREACAYHLEVSPRAQGVLVPIESGDLLARFAADLRAIDLDALLKEEP